MILKLDMIDHTYKGNTMELLNQHIPKISIQIKIIPLLLPLLTQTSFKNSSTSYAFLPTLTLPCNVT
jgi:hypothetical protein